MFIRSFRISGGNRYSILETEDGVNKNTIAWFDSLEDAGLVLRYLKGAWMPKEDQITALRLIHEWDAREAK